MNRRKILIAVAVVGVLGLLAWANLGLRRPSGLSVNVEKVEARDLEAIVSASGKIQPKRVVKASNEAMGKVLQLAVREGDVVKRGQLLLRIDPTLLETQVEAREASLASAKSQLEQSRSQVDNSRVALKEAQDTLKRYDDLLKGGLMPRDQYEKAQNDVKRQTTNLQSSEQGIRTLEERVKQEESSLRTARIDLTKVNIFAPIDGVVTKRLIEEGETARFNVMSGGVDLLEIADLSVIETSLEVDENDIPHIRLGQPAKVTIDAIPDQTFPGKVTEVANSPIAAAGAGRATNFKVVVTILGKVPDVRPGFTCTAVVTTATRAKSVAVPMQAMTVRELVVDAEGNVLPRELPAATGAKARRPIALPELLPGQKRKEIEGAFMVKDGLAVFVPVKTGISGEKYFEVLKGLAAGDEVITGPFESVRNLREGDLVKIQAPSVFRPNASTGKSSPADVR